jgi:hypothetical protein
VGRRVPLDAIQQLPERPCGQSRLLRLAHLRGSHHLHRTGDLPGAAHRLDATADVMKAEHDSPGCIAFPGLTESVDGRLQLGLKRLAERLFRRNLGE